MLYSLLLTSVIYVLPLVLAMPAVTIPPSHVEPRSLRGRPYVLRDANPGFKNGEIPLAARSDVSEDSPFKLLARFTAMRRNRIPIDATRDKSSTGPNIDFLSNQGPAPVGLIISASSSSSSPSASLSAPSTLTAAPTATRTHALRPNTSVTLIPRPTPSKAIKQPKKNAKKEPIVVTPSKTKKERKHFWMKGEA